MSNLSYYHGINYANDWDGVVGLQPRLLCRSRLRLQNILCVSSFPFIIQELVNALIAALWSLAAGLCCTKCRYKHLSRIHESWCFTVKWQHWEQAKIHYRVFKIQNGKKQTLHFEGTLISAILLQKNNLAQWALQMKDPKNMKIQEILKHVRSFLSAISGDL